MEGERKLPVSRNRRWANLIPRIKKKEAHLILSKKRRMGIIRKKKGVRHSKRSRKPLR